MEGIFFIKYSGQRSNISWTYFSYKTNFTVKDAFTENQNDTWRKGRSSTSRHYISKSVIYCEAPMTFNFNLDKT